MKQLNWAQLVLGIWIFVSPWVLGFSEINVALWSNLTAGTLILIISLWKIFGKNQTSPEMPR